MLLLSIHPRFADAILDGSKNVELRRRIPCVEKGEQVLVYSTLPVGAVIGMFTIDRILETKLEPLWRLTRNDAGVLRDEFNDYFDGRETGTGIWIATREIFLTPVSLSMLRKIWPGFHPPQGFRRVNSNEATALFEQTNEPRHRSRAA